MSAFGIKWGIPLLVGLALLGAGAAYVWNGKQDEQQREHDNELLCEGINANRATLRNLLVSARAQTPKRELTTRTRRFYRTQLAKITPLGCGNFDRDSLKGGGRPSGKNKSQPP